MNRSIFLIFVSLGVMLVGHGMQLSLLPLYARELGWSDMAIGITGASYFLGFVCGCFLVPSLLNKAGYIRVYLCAAAVVAGVLLVLGLTTSIVAWVILRFISGLSLVAIYNTVEAWINDQLDTNSRGKILSAYVIVTLVGIGLGQPILAFLNPEEQFTIAASLIMLSILPIGLFAEEQPLQMDSKAVSLATMRSLPTLVTLGVMLVGVTAGVIWTMSPLVGQSANLSSIEIAWMMNALILGGILFQYPLGCLADRFGGSLVIGGVAAICGSVCLLLGFVQLPPALFIFAMFVFGGTSLTLYALCAVEANKASLICKVEIAATLLICHGIGSVMGPFLVGVLSAFFSNAIFLVCAIAMISLAIFALKGKKVERNEVIQLHPFIAEKTTSLTGASAELEKVA